MLDLRCCESGYQFQFSSDCPDNPNTNNINRTQHAFLFHTLVKHNVRVSCRHIILYVHVSGVRNRDGHYPVSGDPGLSPPALPDLLPPLLARAERRRPGVQEVESPGPGPGLGKPGNQGAGADQQAAGPGGRHQRRPEARQVRALTPCMWRLQI